MASKTKDLPPCLSKYVERQDYLTDTADVFGKNFKALERFDRNCSAA